MAKKSSGSVKFLDVGRGLGDKRSQVWKVERPVQGKLARSQTWVEIYKVAFQNSIKASLETTKDKICIKSVVTWSDASVSD